MDNAKAHCTGGVLPTDAVSAGSSTTDPGYEGQLQALSHNVTTAPLSSPFHHRCHHTLSLGGQQEDMSK